MKFVTTPLEDDILADIKRRTGHSFRRIGGIDTTDRKIAETVLPILKEWVPMVKEGNYRRAIFARFLSPYASTYVDSMIEWWQDEKYSLAAECLTQTIARNTQAQHAERLWNICSARRHFPFRFMLLSKLATFPSVAERVKESLVEALDDSRLTIAELQDISQVNDPRIRQWFEARVDCSNANLRRLARKIAGRGKRLPKDLHISKIPPDRRFEVFSAEFDLDEAKALLKQVSIDAQLKIPARLLGLGFLSSLDIDQWVAAPIATTGGEPATLWFRLEDLDVVEIVMTKDTPSERVLQ